MRRRAAAAAVLIAMPVAGCELDGAPATSDEARPPIETVDGLSEAQTARFQRGLAEFLEVDTAIEGLGPLFNAASCSHCHSLGGVGGAG